MDQLAPDQTVEDSEALVASLQHNASSLPYKALEDTLAQVASNLRTLEARRNAAFDAVEEARKALQEQEARLMVEHGGTYPRSYLRQWTEALEKALSKRNSLRNEEARLKQLSDVLSRELHKRDQRREHLIRERLQAKHATHLEAKRHAAIEALASAIAAEAWSHHGMSPADIQPLRFCAEALQEHAIRDAVLRFAAAEQQQAEAEVKADEMYGSGQ